MIASRLARLEDRAPPPGAVTHINWEPHLNLLTDHQLDRFEQLCMKMWGDDPTVETRPMSNFVHVLAAEEIEELKQLVEAMGLEW